MRNRRILAKFLFLVFAGLALPAHADWPRTQSEVQANVYPTLLSYPLGDVRRYGADPSIDNTAAFQNAIRALNGRGTVTVPAGAFRVNAGLNIPNGVAIHGQGYSSSFEVNSRGATVILKTNPGVGIVLNNDSALENLQVEGQNLAGDGVLIKGERASIRNVNVTNHLGNGIRIGVDNLPGNANAFRLDHVFALKNGGHGLYIHHSLPYDAREPSFPQGPPDANAGTVTNLDTRANAGDGVRIRNAIDNKFYGVLSTQNAGHGVRLEQDARGHQFYGLYTEYNTLKAFLATAGANRNMVIGNPGIDIAPGWVDEGAGNYILKWEANVEKAGWSQGPVVNAVSPSGPARIDLYQGVNYNKAASIEAMADPAGSGGQIALLTKRDTNTPVPRLIIDSRGKTTFKGSIRIEVPTSGGTALEIVGGSQSVTLSADELVNMKNQLQALQARVKALEDKAR